MDYIEVKNAWTIPPLAVTYELQGGMHRFFVDVWGNNFLLTFLSPLKENKKHS